VGAPLLTDVTLICNVEASPKAINYWQRENGKLIMNFIHHLIIFALTYSSMLIFLYAVLLSEYFKVGNLFMNVILSAYGNYRDVYS
jgi:hypothetical protein